MESADRMLGRDAQMGRGEWRREGGASLETLTGSDGGVTDCGEGVSPNNWVNFRDFLTRSARSCGCRWFVVGGRSKGRPEKPGLPRGLVSTAVTGTEMEEVQRAWDDRACRKSGLGVGDFPRGG
jgi:hypothetical protein